MILYDMLNDLDGCCHMLLKPRWIRTFGMRPETYSFKRTGIWWNSVVQCIGLPAELPLWTLYDMTTEKVTGDKNSPKAARPQDHARPCKTWGLDEEIRAWRLDTSAVSRMSHVWHKRRLSACVSRTIGSCTLMAQHRVRCSMSRC